MSNTFVQYLQAFAFPYFVWHSSESKQNKNGNVLIKTERRAVRQELAQKHSSSEAHTYHKSHTLVLFVCFRDFHVAAWYDLATLPLMLADVWMSPSYNILGLRSLPEGGKDHSISDLNAFETKLPQWPDQAGRVNFLSVVILALAST